MPRVYSSHDMLGIVAELNARRIPMIMGKMSQRAGGTLALSQGEIGWLQLARQLHHRYRLGDYRHDPNEAARIRDLCQWLVDSHRRFNHQETGVAIPWNADALESKTETGRPKRGDYAQLIDKVHTGELDGAVSE